MRVNNNNKYKHLKLEMNLYYLILNLHLCIFIKAKTKRKLFIFWNGARADGTERLRKLLILNIEIIFLYSSTLILFYRKISRCEWQIKFKYY